jgi:transcriptional regulator with XRE-family HTH domain
MNTLFAETLRKLSLEKGLSQIQLGKKMFVSNSTIARWENGSRMPDTSMMKRLAVTLGVDIGVLFSAVANSDESPNIIIVDDNMPILLDSLSILEKVLPNAVITGFIWPQEAVEYAKANRISMAILDIELGAASGLDLCHTLIDINPFTNVFYLTAYSDYSLDAWNTKACGFIVKPLTPENVRRQLDNLRYPFLTGDTEK